MSDDTDQKGQTGIRIYLDLAGLERLIGGNTAAEVEIREGIVRTFAKKHLKELATSAAFQPYLKQISASVQEELKAQVPLLTVKAPRWIGDPDACYKLDESNPTVAKFKEQLAEEGRKQLWLTCDRAVQDIKGYIDAQFTKTLDALKAEVDKIVAKQIGHKFEQIVKAEVDRRLKEIAKNLTKAGG